MEIGMSETLRPSKDLKLLPQLKRKYLNSIISAMILMAGDVINLEQLILR